MGEKRLRSYYRNGRVGKVGIDRQLQELGSLRIIVADREEAAQSNLIVCPEREGEDDSCGDSTTASTCAKRLVRDYRGLGCCDFSIDGMITVTFLETALVF